MRQFGRYVAIQLVAYVLDMGSFLVLIGTVGDHPVWANIASKIVAGTFAFFGHRRFTFALDRRAAPSEVTKYVLLLLANIPMTSLVLVALLHWTDVVTLAKFLADVSCVGITFLVAKFLVFTRTNGGIPR
ncbi:MAG: GtrA family protein [Chloroflexota bacterium]|nr:GtrA family protein [Chloroflexota bacterium]